MAKLDPKQRQELEAERAFLVRSLEDLEAECAEGGIDIVTYETLHSDYTARTAIVLRALAGGDDTRPKPPPVSRERRWIVYALIGVFTILLGVSLAKAVGTRVPGRTASGNDPNSYEGHMQSAAQFIDAGDTKHALEQYQAAQKVDPKRPEVHVELAKLLIQQIQAGAGSPKLIDAADAALDRAIALDNKYADAYAFKGVVIARFRKQPDRAAPFLKEYLRLAPNGPLAPMASSVLNPASTTTMSRSSPSTSAPTTSTP